MTRVDNAIWSNLGPIKVGIHLHFFGCSFRNIELSLSLESWAHFEIRYFKFMERVGIELLGDIWSSDPLIYFDVSLNRIETFNYV